MEKNLQSEKKTPMPESKYYLPISFLSSIAASLDSKVQVLSETYGFGKVSVTLVIHRGKVSETYFNDEVRIRGLLEQYEKPDKTDLTKEV